VFLALLLLVPSTLFAQYSSGSVVVLRFAGDYIAIAADSLRLGPAAGQVSYDACKVASLGDELVFAETGISNKVSDGKTSLAASWDVFEMARQEYGILVKNHSAHLIPDLAETFGRRLAAQINRDLTLKSSAPLRSYLLEHRGANAVVFAGFDEEHRPVVIEVTVGMKVPGAHEVGYSTRQLHGGETENTEILGETAIVAEFAAGTTERSRGWRSVMALQTGGLGLKESLLFQTRFLAELTAKYAPQDVGDPIDQVLVTRGHSLTWAKRKPRCSREDYAGISGSTKHSASVR
jgi:hypothetical protein